MADNDRLSLVIIDLCVQNDVENKHSNYTKNCSLMITMTRMLGNGQLKMYVIYVAVPSGFFNTRITESPRRNIFEMNRSRATGFACKRMRIVKETKLKVIRKIVKHQWRKGSERKKGLTFFLPLPDFGNSVHISFTFSSTMLQCLKWVKFDVVVK